MGRQSDKVLAGHIEFFRRIVRMGADGAIDFFESLSDSKDLVKSLHARRDGHHAADAGGQGAGDDGRPLLGEVRKVEMAVAVDEHQALASCST